MAKNHQKAFLLFLILLPISGLIFYLTSTSPSTHPGRAKPGDASLLGQQNAIPYSTSPVNNGASGSFSIKLVDIKNTPIILPASPTPYTSQAANYLATYMEKVIGAKPSIIEGMPNPVPSKAIWVGYQNGIEKFFPGADLSFAFPEEVVNVGNENYILISGRDLYDPKKSNFPDAFGRETIANVQQEYGTCNAVFTFLQDQLNIRWLWPGELGEDIIKTESLNIKPFYYRHHPKILDRSGILYRIGLYVHKHTKAEQEWGKFQRIQLSSKYIKGSHAFAEWWQKYGNDHPEYFALNRKGERKPLSKPEHVKICMSNPAVWDRWMKDVEEQLKENPNQTLFSAGANDGWGQGHCTCDKCRAWDYKGFDPKNPELADRDLRFVNTLAKMLKQKYPEKPYKVLALAYGFTRPAPKEVRPDDNVIIINASNFLQQGPEARDKNMKQYADWDIMAHDMVWRPNLGSPLGGIIGFPDISPHQAAEDIKFVAEKKTIGLYFDTYWDHWATQGIQYYALAQLAWNPYLNIDSLLDDYYIRAYGPAANEMKQYWELLENTRNEVVSKINNQARILFAPDFYNGDWMSKAKSLLIEAKNKTTGKYLQRIGFTEIGLKYTELIIECRKLNQAWEKDRANQKLMAAIDKKFEEANLMQKNLAANPATAIAINFDRSFKWPAAKFMMGLHYKSPINKNAQAAIDNAEDL